MADELFDIAGKTALVTGGTSGIGVMIAGALLKRGVKTYISGRDVAQGEAMAARLAAESQVPEGQCIALAADLADAQGPATLAAAFARRESALHVLVNNAGASESGTIDTLPMADWDQVMAVNLRAPFFLAQQLLPLLRAAAKPEDPARIINIGSIGGAHIPNWEAFPYGASKAGLHHLTRALTKRLGREHIIATAIAPGPFPSRLTDTRSDQVQKSVDTYIPLGRAGEPQDIEGLIVFLAARASRYISGVTIPLDGGYLAAL